MVQSVRLSPSGQFVPVGGGGGDVAQLSALRWVDPQTTVDPAEQDGTIAKPFDDVQSALDSLAGLVNYGVICCPGDYGSAAVLWTDAGAELLVLYGFGAVRNLGAITSFLPDGRLVLNGLGTPDAPVGTVTLFDTALGVSGCQLGAIDGNGSAVTVEHATVQGATLVQSLDAIDAEFVSTLQALGAVVARLTRFRAAVNVAAVTANDCSFEDQFTAAPGSAIVARDCTFSQINDGEWQAWSCNFDADAVFESLRCWDSIFLDGCTVTVGAALLESCLCLGLVITTDATSLIARETDFARPLAYSTLEATECTFRGDEAEVVSGGDALIQGGVCQLSLDSTGALQLYSVVFTGAGESNADIDCTSAIIRNCVLSGDVAVVAELQIDWSSYEPLVASGGAVAAATLVLVDRVAPLELASQAVAQAADPNTLWQVPFQVLREFAAPGGGVLDVTVVTAFPFAVRFLDSYLDVVTTSAGNAALRTAAGGGGTLLSGNMSTSAAGVGRALNIANGALAVLAAGTPLVLRLPADVVSGTVYAWLCRA